MRAERRQPIAPATTPAVAPPGVTDITPWPTPVGVPPSIGAGEPPCFRQSRVTALTVRRGGFDSNRQPRDN
jgi:hypothetical protein